MEIPCPICRKPVTDAPAPAGHKSYFPFCSERCKLIDLGRWLGGKYQITVRPEESDDLPPPPARRREADE